MAKKTTSKKCAPRKKTVKKMCMTEDYKAHKETLSFPQNGKKLTVGKKTRITVTGTVIADQIDRYDNSKRSYRMEIDKISRPSNPKPKRR